MSKVRGSTTSKVHFKVNMPGFGRLRLAADGLFCSRENATLISRIGIGLMIYALSAEEQGFAEENPMQTRESAPVSTPLLLYVGYHCLYSVQRTSIPHMQWFQSVSHDGLWEPRLSFPRPCTQPAAAARQHKL
jgi:hypothetical protein